MGNTKRKYRKGKSKRKRKYRKRKSKSKSKSKRKRKYKEFRSFKKKGGAAAEEVDIEGLIDAIKENIIIVSRQKSVLGKSTILEKAILFSDKTITFDNDIDRRKLFRIDYTDPAENQGKPKSLFFKVAPLGPTEIETGPETEGRIKWGFAGSNEEYEIKNEAIAEINKQLEEVLKKNGDEHSVHYEYNPDKCGYYFSEDFYHESIIYYHLNNMLKGSRDLNDNVLNIYGFGVIESENPIFKVKWGLEYDSDEAELFTELVMSQIDRIKTICKSFKSKYITYQIVECDSDYKTIVELQKIYKLDKITIGTILDQCAGLMTRLYDECKFVHYDLLGGNWLISKTTDGHFKIKLFDFDLSIIEVGEDLYKSWVYDDYMVKLQGCGLSVSPDLYLKMIHIFDLYKLYFQNYLEEEFLGYQSDFIIRYFVELDDGTYGLSQSTIEDIQVFPVMVDWYITTKVKIDNSTTKPQNLDDLFNLELYLQDYTDFFRLKQFSNKFLPNEISEISDINETFLSKEAPSNINNFLKVDDIVKQFLFMIWLVVNTISIN